MRRAMAVSLALVATACGGPRVPLQVVGKAVPVNVAFGNANGALPPPEIQRVPGGIVVIPRRLPPDPLPRFRVPPPKLEAPDCPEASPFAFPKKQATAAIPDPPAAAKYPFLLTGERTVDGQKTELAPVQTRTVGNIGETVEGALRWDVSEVSGIEATITSFRADESELAITGIQRVVDGELRPFQPATPVRILPLPPRQTNALGHHITTWASAGLDPVRQTTVTVQGNVLGAQRVDACGELVDSWLAEIQMRTVSPEEDLTSLWRINVATQYGGLIIAESITTTGTRDGKPFEEKRRARITEVPR